MEKRKMKESRGYRVLYILSFRAFHGGEVPQLKSFRLHFFFIFLLKEYDIGDKSENEISEPYRPVDAFMETWN